METTPISQVICSACGENVNEEDKFCAYCGALFSDNFFCSTHSAEAAQGVCVICAMPCCEQCGAREHAIFLCNAHWKYELCEGMVRVAGCTDNVLAQYMTSCLEQAGLHPFLYSRLFNPGADVVSINRIYRNFGEHPICELKVLVPYSEVLQAEDILDELEIDPSGEKQE